MLTVFLLLQAAAAQPAPDIELQIDASIRRMRIDRQGEASLEVHAEPDGGSDVRVAAPEANGRRTLRNVNVRVRAEARIADAPNPQAQIRTDAETDPPQ